jgi:hypothetical protein
VNEGESVKGMRRPAAQELGDEKVEIVVERSIE